jgi:two-component system, LytTR family, sensor histidine kinase AlgZ
MPARKRIRGGTEFLPDFCSAQVLFVVVLIALLLAMLLTLAAAPFGQDFWVTLGVYALFLQWIALTSAGALCALRRPLDALHRARAAAAVYLLLVSITLILSLLAWWLGSFVGLAGIWVPESPWGFLARNTAISAIACAVILRYFYIQHQWRLNVRREARARIESLQARIRPHFLFNSLNTVAALIPNHPDKAERCIEDLSELFRASLTEAPSGVTLAEELDLARRYLELEEMRLGDRLTVDWNTSAANVSGVRVPHLLIQPLVENAVYHGIETRPEGGCLEVRAERDDNEIVITVCNPALSGEPGQGRRGHSMALNNIRQRLELFSGGRAGLFTRQRGGSFEAVLRLPLEMEAPR